MEDGCISGGTSMSRMCIARMLHRSLDLKVDAQRIVLLPPDSPMHDRMVLYGL